MEKLANSGKAVNRYMLYQSICPGSIVFDSRGTGQHAMALRIVILPKSIIHVTIAIGHNTLIDD